ncbi:tetratricopeptide repeat protein [uncultured Microscilla sp.]|uniref:tetratricopeptide repeat protein n=1 Tax=uncultured Microscilla sp. TaxID=432653 RepID=UPI002617E30C|nr:tetratricopeptide repeat protein [uncultured Microscilla sp.]
MLPIQAQSLTDSLTHLLHTHQVDKAQRIKLYNTLASVHSQACDSAKTMHYANLAIALAHKTKDVAGQATACHHLGWCFLGKGHYQQALQIGHQLQAFARQHHYLPGQSQAYNIEGNVYHAQGKYLKALGRYQQALQIAQKGRHEHLVGACLGNIANVYASLGKYPLAKKYYQKALSIAQSNADQLGVAHSYNNLGLVSSRQGNEAKALAYHQQALYLYQQIGSEAGTAQSYHNLGGIYERQQHYQRALEYYQESLHLEKKLNNKKGLAESYLSLGNVYEAQRKITWALPYFQKFIQLSQQMRCQGGMATGYFKLGSLTLTVQQHGRAIAYFEKSLAIRKTQGEQSKIAETLVGLGTACHRSQQNRQALSYLKKALALAQKLNLPHIVRNGNKVLASVYKANKSYEQALESFHVFKQMEDSLDNQEITRKMASTQTQYQLLRQKDSIGRVQAQEKARFTVQSHQERRQRQVLWGGTGVLLGLLLLLLGFYRYKQGKNNQVEKLNQNLACTNEWLKREMHKRLAATESKLNIEKKALEERIANQNQQLTAHTLHMLQKNQALQQLRQMVNEVRQQGDFKSTKKQLGKLANLVNFGLNIDKDWERFHHIFEQLHPDFYTSLKQQFPELNKTDLRMCALIKLNLNNTEIADLLAISEQSVHTKHYRLRKKMNFETTKQLHSFLLSFVGLGVLSSTERVLEKQRLN